MNQNDLMQYCYACIYDQQVIQDDVEHIISMAGNSPLNILEVACGSGRISIPLAQKGHVVTGFDVDEAMLARIPQKVQRLCFYLGKEKIICKFTTPAKQYPQAHTSPVGNNR